MKKFFCALAVLSCVTFSTSTFAEELFPDSKPIRFTPGDELADASTAGGFAIYQGDEHWRLVELSAQQAGTLGDADPVKLGTVGLIQLTPAGEWAAAMYFTTNLTGAGLSQYTVGDPCAGKHLIAINKGKGRDDNCLTVDAERGDAGPQKVSLLVLKVIHSKSAGRRYRLVLAMNLETMGLVGTMPADWTPAAVAAVPERAAFVERLQKWGESLQDASERALGFKKPQDAFAGIPSYRTLVATP